MTSKMRLFELCVQKGSVLMKKANDFIQNGMIQQYQNEPCSRVEYGSGSRYMPRGYYCPSVALDKIIINARRGRLLKRLTQRSKPSHRFIFNEAGKLIMAETKAPFPETTEYIVYEENKILGFSIDANNKITELSEENYEHGLLKDYYFAALSYYGNSIHSGFYERYHYTDEELKGVEHISVPIFTKDFLKMGGYDKMIDHWMLTQEELATKTD